MKEKFIIENVYYKKSCYNEFRIYISIEGVEQDLEIGRSNNSKEYYRVCEYGGQFFYTEELVKRALKLVREAIFCEQFLPDSNYKTRPDFELGVTDFQELKRVINKAWDIKSRTICWKLLTFL